EWREMDDLLAVGSTPPRAPGRATPTALRITRRTPPSSLVLPGRLTRRGSSGNGAGTAASATRNGQRVEHPGTEAEQTTEDNASLISWNGFGGITPDGDYEIHVCGNDLPPAPWVNVIA